MGRTALICRVQRGLIACHLAEDNGDWVFTLCREHVEKSLGRRLKIGETIHLLADLREVHMSGPVITEEEQRLCSIVMDQLRDFHKQCGKGADEELALILGYRGRCPRSHVNQWLKGKNPRLNMIIRYARAMGVSLKDLFEPVDEEMNK